MIQRHAHVDGEAKQVWKILVVLSEGMEDGPSLVAVVRLKFSAWTSEVGDAAMSVAGCANPLFKDLVGLMSFSFPYKKGCEFLYNR